MAEKQSIINTVANTSWGWRKEYLTQLYSAFIHSISTYASFAWWPCIAKTNRKKIERAQNKALQLMTGQYKATPTEALWLECGLPSLKTEKQLTIAKSAEKAERLQQDHPRSIGYSGNTKKCLKRDNWRATSKSFIDVLPAPLNNRVPIGHFTSNPWMEASCIKVFPELEGEKCRQEWGSKKRSCPQKDTTSRHTHSDLHRRVSTQRNLTRWCGSSDHTRRPRKVGGNRHTRKERGRLHMLIRRGSGGYEDGSTMECMALRSYNPETDVIREMLQDFNGSVVIKWIPRYSKILGNNAADLAPKTHQTRSKASHAPQCQHVNPRHVQR